jgi:hypothetical protein
MSKQTFIACITLLVAVVTAGSAAADSTPQPLPFAQAWSNVTLISADDDWADVPGGLGYRGDGLTAVAGTDPQTILADGTGTPLDVMANETNPASLFTGGVAEFELADPVVALQPSGAADAPHLVLTLDTRGYRDIDVSYRLRDLDASSDNAVQAVALQYRVGTTGQFTNVTAGYVADATTGPRLATRVTTASGRLPADASNRSVVQVRILAADAAGSDEWVGIDDIAVSGTSVDDAPPILSVRIASRQSLPRALERGLRPRVTVDEAASLRSVIRLGRRMAEELELPRRIGETTATMAAAGFVRLTVPFSAEAKEKLATLPSVRVTIRVTARDVSGAASRVYHRILLVR